MTIPVWITGVGYEIDADLPETREHGQSPYTLILTESATKRLDLPFVAVDSVADSVDQMLENLSSAT
jgi:hypothetical protein